MTADPANWSGKLMSTAPKDGTMLRLCVQFKNASFEDSNDPCWTIGFNSLDSTGEDRWQFAGWDWCHDVICEGDGQPIAWLPFHDDPAEVAATVQAERDRLLKERHDWEATLRSCQRAFSTISASNGATREAEALLKATLGK